MNIYVISGIALLGFGIFFTINQLKIYFKQNKSLVTWSAKGLGVGVICIVIGIALILKYK